MNATRLNINLSEKARAELKRLATISGRNFTDLVRFGLTLTKTYYDRGPGEELAVVKDGKPVKVIVAPEF